MLPGVFSHAGAELTQVPVRDGVVVVQLVIVFVLVLDAIALVLLGDCAGAMEARPDVLLIVWDGLVFLDVPLVQNEETSLPLRFSKAIWRTHKFKKQFRGSHRQPQLILSYKTHLQSQVNLLNQLGPIRCLQVATR